MVPMKSRILRKHQLRNNENGESFDTKSIGSMSSVSMSSCSLSGDDERLNSHLDALRLSSPNIAVPARTHKGGIDELDNLMGRYQDSPTTVTADLDNHQGKRRGRTMMRMHRYRLHESQAFAHIDQSQDSADIFSDVDVADDAGTTSSRTTHGNKTVKTNATGVTGYTDTTGKTERHANGLTAVLHRKFIRRRRKIAGPELEIPGSIEMSCNGEKGATLHSHNHIGEEDQDKFLVSPSERVFRVKPLKGALKEGVSAIMKSPLANRTNYATIPTQDQSRSALGLVQSYFQCCNTHAVSD